MSANLDLPAEGTPRVLAFLRRLHAVLDDVTEATAWTLTVEELAEAVTGMHAAVSRLVGLEWALLAQADRAGVGTSTAATSTAAWLQDEARLPRRVALEQVRVARALDSDLSLTGTAVRAGRMSPDQATAAVAAVSRLPDWLGEGERRRAEAHLVELARTLDSAGLRRAGRHLLDVVDPAGADERLHARLTAEERLARRRTFLELHDNADGTHSGRFRIPSLHAAMLTKMLWAHTSPRRLQQLAAGGSTRYAGRDGDSGRPPGPELRGAAWCELIERMRDADLPAAAGAGATVVVTMTLDQLREGLGGAQVDTGAGISASEARRLACVAGVVPLVLGGPSEVLDQGRRVRYHTKTQRLALVARDRGCTAAGCDRPAAWCEAHHDNGTWASGATTSVQGGRLLCSFHHHRAHDPTYHLTHLPTGRVRFTRRT